MAMNSYDTEIMLMAALDPVVARDVEQMWDAELSRKQHALRLLKEVQDNIQLFVNTTSLEKVSVRNQFDKITKEFLRDEISCQTYIERGRVLLERLRAYEKNKYKESKERYSSITHRLADRTQRTGEAVYIQNSS